MIERIGSLQFTYTTYIVASPERVWEALTNAAFTEKYWANRHVISTWKTGASIQMLKPDGRVDWEGEIVAITPPTLMEFTFRAPRVEPEANEPPTNVTIELVPQETAVRLTLVHEGFAAGSKSFPAISEGWPALLSSLKTLLETGKPIEFPAWRGK